MTDIVRLFLFRNISKSLLFLQKKVICITDEIRARDGCSASTKARLFHVHGHACDVRCQMLCRLSSRVRARGYVVYSRRPAIDGCSASPSGTVLLSWAGLRRPLLPLLCRLFGRVRALCLPVSSQFTT